MGLMPRGLARLLAGLLAFAVYRTFGRLRRVGVRNLELALPEALAGRTHADSARRLPPSSAGNWSSSAA
jgi:lauroyl/myristoyl acyltransferase